MAKAYVCDACEATITDPYTAKMREFYVGMEFECGMAFPCNVKTFVSRVHLCDECYHALKTIAKKVDANG